MILVVVFTQIIHPIIGGCPHSSILYPCTCHHSIFGTHVYCGGSSHINLENIFDSMSNDLVSDKKHFTHLTLTNSAVHQLNENTFRDITFESILIENSLNLSQIHRNAFTDTNWFTKSFSIKNCSKMENKNDDLFYSLSKFRNLETLEIFDTNITEIPSFAFKPINGYQNQLKTISIKGKMFRRIGDNAFRYLNSLTNLTFVDTSIALIPDYALTFSRISRIKIQINFTDNHLMSGSSFSKNSLAYISRPTQLIGISATVLSEEIFLPFLNSNDQNMIEMSNQTKLECNNCANFWLRRNFELLSRVLRIQCTNGLNLMSNNNFILCVH